MTTPNDANTKKLAEAAEICADLINQGFRGLNINSAVTGLNVIDSEVIPALTSVCKSSGTALVESLQVVERHGGEMGAKSVARVRAELVHVMFDTAEKLWRSQHRQGWQAQVHKMMDAVNLVDPAQIDNRKNQSPEYFALVHAWRTGQLAPPKLAPVAVETATATKSGSKETLEKLFSLACKNENLGAAQLLYATGKIEALSAGREAVKLWNPDNPMGKNKTNAWRELMRWLISTVVQKDADKLAEYVANGWSELIAAWAAGAFVDTRTL